MRFAAWLRCAVLVAPLVAVAAPTAGDVLEARIDALVHAGYDRPDDALAGLTQLRGESVATPALDRLYLQAEALVQAQAGRPAEAGALAERLLALSRDQRDPLAAASSNLVRAVLAETGGQLDVAAALAQSAAAVLEPACRSTGSPLGAADAAPPPCDHRSLWRALQVLERRALSLGQFASAHDHAQAAFDLADAVGDAQRKALSLGALGNVAARSGQADVALRSVAQAKRMAAALGQPTVMARVRINEARVAHARGDGDAVLRALEEGFALARRADAPRLQALLLTNLSDAYVKRGRAADALRAATRALPTVREFHDLRTELVLINNLGLAKVGLGRIAEGRLDMVRVMDAKLRSGAVADQAVTLREFGEALAAAGDPRGALELYHRERRLHGDVMQRNRSVVLKEMQTRYDAEAKQRSIELVRRDNALKTEALANRDLTQRIWLVVAALMALSIALALLLVRRVRETNRQLEASHARLRVASERDPLTHLANRRHFHAAMESANATSDGFTGALLLVDIDHFKHINDGHGHSAGDVVLVEVARRLATTVRDEDMVVRWGGEEFLIVAASLSTEQTDQLAARVLAILGGTPVRGDGKAIRVTASIGYACFPLPPYAVAVGWEQAVNLADMALYSAKSQGRNRAVGLASAVAPDAVALRAIERDFERAWRDGQVSLRQTPGPGSS